MAPEWLVPGRELREVEPLLRPAELRPLELGRLRKPLLLLL
jgi:hypothetical protein